MQPKILGWGGVTVKLGAFSGGAWRGRNKYTIMQVIIKVGREVWPMIYFRFNTKKRSNKSISHVIQKK